MRWGQIVTGCITVLGLSLLTATSAHATTPAVGAGAVRGVDVSSFQHVNNTINWQQVARAGMKFAAIKVTEGTYYTNPYYASDARAAAAAGLAVVPYVFANPGASSGAAQARFGVAAAHYTGHGALPLEVDLENDPYATNHHPDDCYALSAQKMIGWIAAFSAQTVALTGKPPIIYTSARWWRECTGGTAQFGRDPLWVAAYDTPAPGMPSAWTKWTFWQYANNAKVPGVGVVDVDFFHSTPALLALSGKPAPVKVTAHHHRKSRTHSSH